MSVKDSDTGPNDKDPKNVTVRNQYQFVGGLVLIGIAIALLLFGGRLVGGKDQEDAPRLVQVPDFEQVESGGLSLSSDGLIEVGDKAYDFSLEDLDGNGYTLSNFLGKPVVLNFWATWCAPCRVEMPELQSAFERYQDDGLIILALDYAESPDTVRSFFYDELGLTFTPLLDREGLVAEQYGIFNFPSTIFVGQDGVVKAIHMGPLVQQQLETYLAEIIPVQE